MAPGVPLAPSAVAPRSAPEQRCPLGTHAWAGRRERGSHARAAVQLSSPRTRRRGRAGGEPNPGSFPRSVLRWAALPVPRCGEKLKGCLWTRALETTSERTLSRNSRPVKVVKIAKTVLFLTSPDTCISIR